MVWGTCVHWEMGDGVHWGAGEIGRLICCEGEMCEMWKWGDGDMWRCDVGDVYMWICVRWVMWVYQCGIIGVVGDVDMCMWGGVGAGRWMWICGEGVYVGCGIWVA